jgi:hypothetical protein
MKYVFISIVIVIGLAYVAAVCRAAAQMCHPRGKNRRGGRLGRLLAVNRHLATPEGLRRASGHPGANKP